MRQGCPLSDSQVRKIIHFLKTTDMSMVDIATSIGCTRSTVAKINQQHSVRDFVKLRSSWHMVERR